MKLNMKDDKVGGGGGLTGVCWKYCQYARQIFPDSLLP